MPGCVWLGGLLFSIMVNELDEFLSTFKFKIGKESFDKISKVLRENDFTSRLSLQLLSSENLDNILQKSDVPLGARKILEYHIDLLRDQSPLIVKSGKYKVKNFQESNESMHGQTSQPVINTTRVCMK